MFNMFNQEVFYEKIGRRYFALNDFRGFPADGVFCVSDTSNSLVVDKKWIENHGEKKAFFAALFFEYLDKLIQENKYDLFSLIEHLSSLKSVSLNKPRFIELKNKNVIKDVYIKRKPYKKIGQSFLGFPSTGIFFIKDGKNNDIKMLNFNGSNFNLNVDSKSIYNYIDKNKKSERPSLYETLSLLSSFLSLNIILT